MNERTRIKRRAATLVAGALCAMLLVPQLASATETFKFSGRGADAMYDEYDEATGAYTSVYVTGGDFKDFMHFGVGAPTRTARGKAVDVYIAVWDPGAVADPTDDVMTETMGTLSPAAFTIDRAMSAASAKATVPATTYVYDGQYGPVGEPKLVSETPTTVAVDLTWAAIGGVTRDRSISSGTDEGISYRFRNIGTYRNAKVAGSVVLGGQTWQGADMFGSLFDARSGSSVMID